MQKKMFTYPSRVSVGTHITERLKALYSNQSKRFLITESSFKVCAERNKDNVINDGNILSIAQLQTYTGGGAGIASLRLHKALLQTNVNTHFFCMDAQDVDIKNVHEIKAQYSKYYYTHLLNTMSQCTLEKNALFGFNYATLQFAELDFLQYFDVIHLHWVQSMLSAECVAYLSHGNVPLVWTMHDKNLLTGGCHCFHNCNKWKKTCKACPQLLDKSMHVLPEKILEFKKENFNSKNMTIITLNTEFASLCKQSPILKHSRIEVISNSIELDTFIPFTTNKKQALKKQLKIKAHKKVLLFVSAYASSIKGYKEFLQMAQLLRNKEQYHVIVVGNVTDDFYEVDIDFTSVGGVALNKMLDFYNVADYTVIPSMEDNQPNILLESLSCGTPVVGFEVGAIGSNVINKKTGYTVKRGDVKNLAQKIDMLANMSVSEYAEMSNNCREYAQEVFNAEVQAKKHTQLYEDIIKQSKKRTQKQSNIQKTIPEYIPEIKDIIINRLQNELSISLKNNYESYWHNIENVSKIIQLKKIAYYTLRLFYRILKKVLRY